MQLNDFYDSIYKEYIEVLKNEGIRGVFRNRKQAMAEIAKIEIFLRDNEGKVIDVKDTPHIFIFRDYLYKVRYTIKTFLLLKSIMVFIVNAATIPIIVLSIYLLIRKIFIIASILFTSSITSVYLAENYTFFNYIRINLLAIKETFRILSLHIHNFLFSDNVAIYPVEEIKSSISLINKPNT
jgi:hypothetical protein